MANSDISTDVVSVTVAHFRGPAKAVAKAATTYVKSLYVAENGVVCSCQRDAKEASGD